MGDRTFQSVPWIGVIGMMAIIAFGSTCAWGYEEAAVVSGGTVSGRVFLKGVPPPTRIFHMVFSPNIEYCSQISDGKGNRLLKEFRVSPDHGFRDVVVAVVGVERGKRFDFNPAISIQTCQIGPFVIPVRNQHPITLVNKDPITHDLQAYTLKDEYTFQMFNKPMVAETSAVKQVRFRKDHYIFRTQCGIHDFMQSWGMAVGNPYFAVTGPDGTFTIPDLPPGTYDVIAWHPYMKVQAQQVTVPPDGKVVLDFLFDASEVDVPTYSIQTGYRLETALDTVHLDPPDIELQTP
jgi:Carboxypeptidase regulatory-like domain